MAKSKKPDLRDKNAPRTSITNTDERLAGAEKPSVAPIKGAHLVRPGPGGYVPAGQGTKSS